MNEIITCIKNNSPEELKFLLSNFKEPLKKHNDTFLKYLEHACNSNFYDIVRILLNYTDRYGHRLTNVDMCIAKTFHLHRDKISRLFYMDDRVLIEDKIFYLGVELYLRNFENFKTILDYNPDIDPLYSNNELFIRACAYGSWDIMNYLYFKYKANPSEQQNRALQRACENNHIDIVKFLLNDPRVNPSDRNDIIFRSSVRKNRNNIVKLLLTQRIDPSVNDNVSLKIAFEHQNYEIMSCILNSEKCYDTPQIKSFLANDYLINDMYDEVVKFYIRKDTSFDFIVNNSRFIEKRLRVLLTRFQFKHFVENYKFNKYAFTLDFNFIESFKLYFMNKSDYSLEALKIIFGINFENVLNYFSKYESLNKVLTTQTGSIIFSYL